MQVLPICFHQRPQTVACDSVDTPVLTKKYKMRVLNAIIAYTLCKVKAVVHASM